jgi:hypothetical protein
MEDIWIIITSSASSVVLLGIVGWLTREWISTRLKSAIQHEYDYKLEAHKTQLKAESDVTLERLKNDLKTEADSKSIRLAKTFDRMADTIATTYEKLVVFMDSVADYVKFIEWSSDPPKEERRKIVSKLYQEFLDYYRPRRIFFIRETADKIDNIHRQVSHAAQEFMFGVEQGGDYKAKEERDTWSKVNDLLGKEVPPLLQELEKELQSVLGIDQCLLPNKALDTNSLPALSRKYETDHED